jgi:hypothetical protein
MRRVDEHGDVEGWKIAAFARERSTLRDVKNEDRPGYVYENKCAADKMYGD